MRELCQRLDERNGSIEVTQGLKLTSDQICKPKKSINQFQDEQNEINGKNKYNHTNR